MRMLDNLIPLGFTKKNIEEFKKLNLKCYALIDSNCKNHLYDIFKYLSNQSSKELYFEIRGDDNRLNNFLASNNLKTYRFTPMKSVGFLKFELGTLQFFSNDFNVFNNIISLWDSELFLRIMLFQNDINNTLELSCSHDYISLLSHSDIVITQSGDGDEIEIIESSNYSIKGIVAKKSGFS